MLNRDVRYGQGADSDSLSLWVGRFKPDPRDRLRLFCFPYAGGSAQIYFDWRDPLAEIVDVLPVQLPGRGSRLSEVPFNNITLLVEAISQAIIPHLDKPFAFFGHSMGALLSFELARSLRRNGRPTPVHLFVSGCSAPHVRSADGPVHQLPDESLIEKLRTLNGTSSDVLESNELIKILLPSLRADFEICETYHYTPEPKFDFPVTVLAGLEDKECPLPEMEAWKELTDNEYSVHLFPGDHFFLHPCMSMVMKIIARKMQSFHGNRSK